MRRLAHCRVVHTQIATDRPHDHFTGVQADPNVDRDTLDPAHAVAVAPHRFLHPQRGVTGTNGVIFVRQRRTEQRHDAVTHHLVHRALVAMDSFHHQLEDGIEEPARLLGIPVGEQLHGPLEVGEKDRHLLALTLERPLRREDLHGKMLRRVALGGGRTNGGRGPSSDGLAAPEAEPGAPR